MVHFNYEIENNAEFMKTFKIRYMIEHREIYTFILYGEFYLSLRH